jgi:hypothetical protein
MLFANLQALAKRWPRDYDSRPMLSTLSAQVSRIAAGSCFAVAVQDGCRLMPPRLAASDVKLPRDRGRAFGAIVIVRAGLDLYPTRTKPKSRRHNASSVMSADRPETSPSRSPVRERGPPLGRFGRPVCPPRSGRLRSIRQLAKSSPAVIAPTSPSPATAGTNDAHPAL